MFQNIKFISRVSPLPPPSQQPNQRQTLKTLVKSHLTVKLPRIRRRMITPSHAQEHNPESQ